MIRNHLKLFTTLFTLLLTTSILANDRDLVASTQKLEGFEKPDQWSIKFSASRCEKWINSSRLLNGEDSSKADSKAAAPEKGADTKAKDAGEALPKDLTSQAPDTWLKWIDTSALAPALKYSMLPQGLPPADVKSEKTILGLKGCWAKKGYNWLAIEPKTPLITPSDPMTISFWFWGANFNYDVSVVIKNDEGTYYTLYLGDLNFYGWRNLRVNIPDYLFPKNRHNLNRKLNIVRLKITASPMADEKGFYTYVDYAQVVYNNAYKAYNGNGLSRVQW